MGLKVGSTLSSCVVIAGSIPFMSAMDNANVDTFSLRESKINRCISSDRYAPIRSVQVRVVDGQLKNFVFLGANIGDQGRDGVDR